MYKAHTHCRACGYATPGPQGIKAAPGDKLIPVLDLGVQPLANAFCADADEHPGFAPLKVLFCPRCSLAQLSVVVRPDILYSHYSYITSASDMMKAHFALLWEDIQRERVAKNVLEIGSNTGDFLEFCLQHGAGRVVGIDPAENLCQIAEGKGIKSIAEPFNSDSAARADAWLLHTDVVIARHVFCHIDDWREFIASLIRIGNDETLYCIEVPYAPDMLAMNSWDQIYHEHLSYLTFRSMTALLKGSGLHIHNFRKYPIHGGAVVIMLRKDGCHESPDVEICAEVGMENVTEDAWKSLAKRAQEEQQKLKATIEALVAQGKTVVGFGASAKSTVWINACGLTRKHLRFICDNTPQKQYKFSPGSDIPIVDEGALLRELPDYAVMFCWNFAAECLKKNQLYLKEGGKFIVPVPEVRIVN